MDYLDITKTKLLALLQELGYTDLLPQQHHDYGICDTLKFHTSIHQDMSTWRFVEESLRSAFDKLGYNQTYPLSSSEFYQEGSLWLGERGEARRKLCRELIPILAARWFP